MVTHDGHFATYSEWPMVLSPEPSFLVLPLGGYGVLYPPGSLNPVVGDRGLIRGLAPLNDDIWFKAMSLTRDVPCRAIGGTHVMPEFKFRGSTTLSQLNQDGTGQDAALGQVFGHLGLTVDAILAKEARLHSEPGPHWTAGTGPALTREE
jgi:hypothetical protein